MDPFVNTEILVIELILVVTLVAIVVRRLRIPYTVALVVVGLALTLQRRPAIQLSPNVILGLLVPPLVFEAAFQLDFAQLRRSLPRILLLAVPGVVLTTLIVGGLVALLVPLALPVALVFGALISATDPVAVVALFRSLGAPRRLALLVEGESLLNDGTAIVLFDLVLMIALTGQFSLLQGLLDFLRVSIGGVLTGLLLGWLVSEALARIDDTLIETTLTTLLAFGSYLLAEELHVSGVLAVVAAGLINGNVGPRGMGPSTRIMLANFWDYVAFLATSMVFLLIGLQFHLSELVAGWRPILWAVLAVLAARAIVVYGLGWICSRFGEAIPLAWDHVLAWGGLRGAISLALALSLPAALGAPADRLRVMAFGVVLFTLLVQGTTMGPLLRRLGITVRSPVQTEYELRHARLAAAQAALRHLDQLYRRGLVSTQSRKVLEAEWEERSSALADQLHEILSAEPQLEAKELDTTRRELLRAQRTALLGLRRDGVISDEVYEELTVEIDAVLVGERGSRPAIASNEDAAVGLERAELDPGDADFARSTAPAPALPDEEAGPAQSGAAPAAPKP
jgi:CPA1 family monovalent cation:H+ antiporter